MEEGSQNSKLALILPYGSSCDEFRLFDPATWIVLSGAI